MIWRNGESYGTRKEKLEGEIGGGKGNDRRGKGGERK